MPFPAFKAWLAGVFTKRGQLETSTPQPGPLRFLDLPTDVLLCILDQATLTDMILLSQTCQWLHKLLYVKCRILFDRSEERINIRNELARRLLDFRHCSKCSQLHRINFNKSFVLWVPLSNFREGNRSTNKRRSLSTTSCNYEMVQQFNILTTKRTWMDHSHRVYLADFLRAQYEPQGLGRLADKLAMRYKIVQDRFLVKVYWEFTSSRKNFTADALTKAFHSSWQCPTEHNQGIRDVVQKHERRCCTGGSKIKRRFSCRYCPKEVEREIGAHYARFSMWCDLGTGEYCVREYHARWRPVAYRKHESIREMYEQGDFYQHPTTARNLWFPGS